MKNTLQELDNVIEKLTEIKNSIQNNAHTKESFTKCLNKDSGCINKPIAFSNYCDKCNQCFLDNLNEPWR